MGIKVNVCLSVSTKEGLSERDVSEKIFWWPGGGEAGGQSERMAKLL